MFSRIRRLSRTFPTLTYQLVTFPILILILISLSIYSYPILLYLICVPIQLRPHHLLIPLFIPYGHWKVLLISLKHRHPHSQTGSISRLPRKFVQSSPTSLTNIESRATSMAIHSQKCRILLQTRQNSNLPVNTQPNDVTLSIKSTQKVFCCLTNEN